MAKIEDSGVKRFKISPKLFSARLITTCAFSCFALTMYLVGYINFPALCLIVSGALWNFFVDINSFVSFMLSLAVGILYGFFAISEGLYVHALLYLVVYVALQFYVYVEYPRNLDMSIKKDKKFSGQNIYNSFIFFVLTMAVFFAFAIVNKREVLPLFDSFSACMLAFSAFLQVYMFREYYVVRICAVVCAIGLWIAVMLTSAVSFVAVTMIMLYSMYLVHDIIAIIIWHKTVPAVIQEDLISMDNEGNKVLVEEKIAEFAKMVDDPDDDKDSTYIRKTGKNDPVA